MSLIINNWKWRQYGNKEWTACKHNNAITEIFPDLVDAGVIPDPFLDQNEKLVQWVGRTDWEYSAEFDYDNSMNTEHKYLVFEGLDTYASVSLNGSKILESSNMFHMHRVDVKDHLVQGKNLLKILFLSAQRESKAEEARHEQLKVYMGDTCRLYSRKAQYHFGWDWGPCLITCGPWRPVRLETYNSKVHDVYVQTTVDKDLQATLDIQFTVSTVAATISEVRLYSPSGELISSDLVDIPANSLETKFSVKNHLKNPELWFPRGYGEQKFYKVEVSLKDGSATDSFTRKVGLRRAELVQEPLIDQPGTSFYFRVNNIPIYISGSNWIPGHSYLTRLTEDDYRDWIQLAVKGNQNMLRAWAGGVFEDNKFYEICDEKGVLVWQDFLFGCGQYPYYKELANSIRKECEDQVRRLRNFPSVVIYAGNNEDYQVAESYNLEWDPKDNSGNWENTTFPARIYYERLLPEIVDNLSPGTVYHPGSPWGGNGTTDQTIGDMHQWNVWHGTQEKYQNWGKLFGRFVSEFGMEALPSLSTWKKTITNPDQLYPQSASMDIHNKAEGFERRLALYVMENLRVDAMDLESWIYATQLMQSECLAYAYRSWRRNWKGNGREYTSGALVWQLNDCWPVTSWAVCDFYKQPKLAYYAIKRESMPISLGIERNSEMVKESFGEEYVTWLQDYLYDVDIWGVNVTLQEKSYGMEVRVYHVESGALVRTLERKKVVLAPNQATELVGKISVTQSVAIQAILFDEKDNVIYRASDWPQPLKTLSFPQRNVHMAISEDRISLSAQRPVKGVELIYNGSKIIEFEDNGFDLFPDDEYVVKAAGVSSGDDIKVRYYGSDIFS